MRVLRLSEAVCTEVEVWAMEALVPAPAHTALAPVTADVNVDGRVEQVLLLRRRLGLVKVFRVVGLGLVGVVGVVGLDCYW